MPTMSGIPTGIVDRGQDIAPRQIERTKGFGARNIRLFGSSCGVDLDAVVSVDDLPAESGLDSCVS